MEQWLYVACWAVVDSRQKDVLAGKVHNFWYTASVAEARKALEAALYELNARDGSPL